jgi:hypothetical protein
VRLNDSTAHGYTQAVELFAELERAGWGDKWIYQTHAWLIQEFFNKTSACGRGQRNRTVLDAWDKAIRAGKIVWHGLSPIVDIGFTPTVLLNASFDLVSRGRVYH